MKFGATLLGTLGFLALSGTALAQTQPPPARTGFQMDVRTGYSIPMGKVANSRDFTATESGKLSDVVSGQVPIIVSIGGKLIPELYLGGYLGLAFGGAADALSCSSCSSAGVRFGAEVQYHILPAALANPWLGYGLGIESVAVGDGDHSLGWGGFQFARFMGGVDFRLDRVFGIGPFVDLSLGNYSTISTGDQSVKITDTALHQWLTIGVRAVFFP